MLPRVAGGAVADSHLPILDTHQHLWDRSRLEPPWLKQAPEILRRSYVTADYLAATKGLNVVKAIYMEIDVAPQDHLQEAHQIIELCRSGQHPTVAAVISGRPSLESFPEYLSRFRGSPYVKGLRQVLHGGATPAGYCLQDTFVHSMRLLGEMELNFDLCMRPPELGDGVRLVEQCPDTRFVVDHCGNADCKAFLSAAERGDRRPSHDPNQWRRDLARLAQHENVFCKISGIIAHVPQTTWDSEILAPIVNHCLDEFGADRVVFGGDWPVCLRGGSYRRWVTSLKEIIRDRPEVEQRKLLHENALTVYRL
jgi:predicted TIM-barrel fold metal-dependent hydrolase